MKSKNFFEAFEQKELPEKLQNKVNNFASQGKSAGEFFFRAGFYIGRDFEVFREAMSEGEENI